MKPIRVHLKIRGKVQGVFYRASTRQKGIELGLKGYAKNLEDGSVEVLAEGEKDKIDQLVQWCRQGPPRAQVIQMEETVEEYRGEWKDFSIHY